jgi:hypothetical protein
MEARMSKSKWAPPPRGYKYIYRRWRINPKTKQREYPKSGRYFRMLVPDDE